MKNTRKTSLILSALFENEEVIAINCQERELFANEESTQTVLTNEESSLIVENSTEHTILNVEPDNENIVVIRGYEKPNNLQQ